LINRQDSAVDGYNAKISNIGLASAIAHDLASI